MRYFYKLPLVMLMAVAFVFSASAEQTDSVINIKAVRLLTECAIAKTEDKLAIDSLEIDSLAVDSLAIDSLSLGEVDGIVLLDRVVLPDSNTVFDKGTMLNPSYMFIPVIFEKQQIVEVDVPKYVADKNPLQSDSKAELNSSDDWLKQALRKSNFENYHINNLIFTTPELVKYNVGMLPEPPKQYVIVNDPAKSILSIQEFDVEIKEENIAKVKEYKPKKWITKFEGALQFSQAYLSDNWYQGGEGNLNVLGSFQYTFNLNPNIYKKVLLENTIQYNVGMNSAPQDSLRGYALSADLFQINSKFGLKAVERWYYSATLQFKTQIFNNYAANSNDLVTSFFTPGELNIGLGMTYDFSESDKKCKFSASISPLSYNMKACINSEKVDFTSLGYTLDRRVQNSMGSSAEGNFVWNINAVFTYSSRLYLFTDYGNVQGDWENTLTVMASKYLSTNLYVHLRYDDSATPSTQGWNYWQLKEILSFGLNYRF